MALAAHWLSPDWDDDLLTSILQSEMCLQDSFTFWSSGLVTNNTNLTLFRCALGDAELLNKLHTGLTPSLCHIIDKAKKALGLRPKVNQLTKVPVLDLAGQAVEEFVDLNNWMKEVEVMDFVAVD